MFASATNTVPATTANLGPGFDCLGLALGMTNQVTFNVISGGLFIEVQGEGAEIIPIDETNLVFKSADRLFELVGRRPPGLQIVQNNRIPVSSGLGSSAAAVLSGILAANTLLGFPLTDVEILTLATEIEGHPDNVTPAFYGGLTLSLFNGDDLVVEHIPVPDMTVVIVLPDFDLSTIEARAALPTKVPMADAIFNIGRVGLLVRALEAGDYGRLQYAMQDKLHQPYRMRLIPGMETAFKQALKTGAAGVALSGAGPSLIAFAPDRHEAIEQAMRKGFASAGLGSRSWILPIFRQKPSQ
jgi:homoserine kinase